MIFDIVSAVAGTGSSLGHDSFVSATHVIVAGAVVSLATATTGFWDWWRGTIPGTEVRRVANWHMPVMLTVTAIVFLDIVVRLLQWDEGSTQPLVLVLSLLAGGLVGFGALYGGALVYQHGFNVELTPVEEPAP